MINMSNLNLDLFSFFFTMKPSSISKGEPSFSLAMEGANVSERSLLGEGWGFMKIYTLLLFYQEIFKLCSCNTEI